MPISERMLDLLILRCRNRRDEWLFPSPRAAEGHLTTVANQFREARSKAELPGRWCFTAPAIPLARQRTKPPATRRRTAMVMKVMGHTDVRTSMRYRHPVLDSIREAIDLRNSRHNPRHHELREQWKTTAVSD